MDSPKSPERTKHGTLLAKRNDAAQKGGTRMRSSIGVRALWIGAAALSGGLSIHTARAQTYDGIYPTANQNTPCAPQAFGFGLECQQANRNIRIFVDFSVTDNGVVNVVNNINTNYEPTDLAFFWEDPPVLSVANTWPHIEAETDIVYWQFTLPAGLAGLTFCDDTPFTVVSPNRLCDQVFVVFASSTPGEDIICHETGHAVGLTHGSAASPAQPDDAFHLRCMRANPTGDKFLSTHAQVEINNIY